MTVPDPAASAPAYPDPSRRQSSSWRQRRTVDTTGRAAGVGLGLAMFVGGALGTWLCWRFFVTTATGQRLDAVSFRGSSIGRSTLWQAAEPVLDLIDVPFIVLVIGASALIAVMRRRWLLALQVAVLVGGANVTTQVLKRAVLDRPDLVADVGSAGNSLPSGHTTAAASVAAALLLVVPHALRPVVAIGAAAYAAITGVSTMIGGWHRPSDVVAAIMVVVAWAGLVTVLTAMSRPEARTSSGRTTTGVAAGLLAAAGAVAAVFAVVALRRTRDALEVSTWLDDRSDLATAYVGGALGVVAAAAFG